MFDRQFVWKAVFKIGAYIQNSWKMQQLIQFSVQLGMT
jgi:hypothetical protein